MKIFVYIRAGDDIMSSVAGEPKPEEKKRDGRGNRKILRKLREAKEVTRVKRKAPNRQQAPKKLRTRKVQRQPTNAKANKVASRVRECDY
jgi:hypothetical protein